MGSKQTDNVRMIDFWSLGLVISELLTGFLPFYNEDIHILVRNIKSGNYMLPDTLSDDAKDLIKRVIVNTRDSFYIRIRGKDWAQMVIMK